jgi:hypothetical protein
MEDGRDISTEKDRFNEAKSSAPWDRKEPVKLTLLDSMRRMVCFQLFLFNGAV